MSAPEFDELLSAYLDNEVTPEERAIVEQRLERSPATRETLDELSDVSEVVKSLPRSAAPDSLVSRVMEQVRTAPVRPAPAATASDAGFFRHLRRRRVRNSALIAAACVVVAVVFLKRPAGHNEGFRDGDRSLASNADLAPAAASASPRSAPVVTASAAPKSGELNEGVLASTEVADRLSASELETLKELVKSRGQVGRTDLFRTLSMNSGEIDVKVFYVTDVRGFAGATQALLTRNGIDLLEVDAPSEPATKSDGADRYDAGVFAMFVEAEGEHLDESLEQIEKFPEVKEVEDFGTLAEIADRERQVDAVNAPSLAEQPPAAPDAGFNRSKSEAPPPRKPVEDEPVATRPASRSVADSVPEGPKKSAKDEFSKQLASDAPPPPAAVVDPSTAGDAIAENSKPSDAPVQSQINNNGYQVRLPSDEAMQLVNQVQNVAQRDATKQKLSNRSSRYGRMNQNQNQLLRSEDAKQQSVAEEPKPGRVLIILQGGSQPAGALSAPSQTPP